MSQGILMSPAEHDYVKYNMPDERLSAHLAEFYSVFSDPTRLKILSALSIADMCVGDLAILLGLNQSTISHQLKLLKDAGIVNYRRSGKVVTYEVVNPFVEDVMMTGIDNLDLKEGRYSPV